MIPIEPKVDLLSCSPIDLGRFAYFWDYRVIEKLRRDPSNEQIASESLLYVARLFNLASNAATRSRQFPLATRCILAYLSAEPTFLSGFEALAATPQVGKDFAKNFGVLSKMCEDSKAGRLQTSLTEMFASSRTKSVGVRLLVELSALAFDLNQLDNSVSFEEMATLLSTRAEKLCVLVSSLAQSVDNPKILSASIGAYIAFQQRFPEQLAPAADALAAFFQGRAQASMVAIISPELFHPL